jgi:hypothetical protein
MPTAGQYRPIAGQHPLTTTGPGRCRTLGLRPNVPLTAAALAQHCSDIRGAAYIAASMSDRDKPAHKGCCMQDCRGRDNSSADDYRTARHSDAAPALRPGHQITINKCYIRATAEQAGGAIVQPNHNPHHPSSAQLNESTCTVPPTADQRSWPPCPPPAHQHSTLRTSAVPYQTATTHMKLVATAGHAAAKRKSQRLGVQWPRDACPCGQTEPHAWRESQVCTHGVDTHTAAAYHRRRGMKPAQHPPDLNQH